MERTTGALGGSVRPLTSAEAADRLGMTLSTFQKRWRALGIPAVKRGHWLRFLERDGDHWLAQQRVNGGDGRG